MKITKEQIADKIVNTSSFTVDGPHIKYVDVEKLAQFLLDMMYDESFFIYAPEKYDSCLGENIKNTNDATQEMARCDFCGEIAPVKRQYLHAFSVEHIDTNKANGFTITKYCNKCGIQENFEKYKDALIWCSGSNDFAMDGKARAGWEKICKPLLNNLPLYPVKL